MDKCYISPASCSSTDEHDILEANSLTYQMHCDKIANKNLSSSYHCYLTFPRNIFLESFFFPHLNNETLYLMKTGIDYRNKSFGTKFSLTDLPLKIPFCHDSDYFEHFKYSVIIDSISLIMSCITSTVRQNEECTSFDSFEIPSISMRDYFIRLSKYFRCSPSAHVIAMIYLDRLVQNVKGLLVDVLNIHRLYVTALVLATKLYDDRILTNRYYAEIGGLATIEINKLELLMLKMLNYQLIVRPWEFDYYVTDILTIAEYLDSNELNNC